MRKYFVIHYVQCLVNILGGWEGGESAPILILCNSSRGMPGKHFGRLGGERAPILILCNSSCRMPGKHFGRLGGRGESTYFDTL